jgi:hypothetical protein
MSFNITDLALTAFSMYISKFSSTKVFKNSGIYILKFSVKSLSSLSILISQFLNSNFAYNSFFTYSIILFLLRFLNILT